MSKIRDAAILACWMISFGMCLSSMLGMAFMLARTSPLAGVAWLTVGWGSYIGMLWSLPSVKAQQ